MDRVIGRRPFTDGLERDLYEDAEGRQYVLNGDGPKVYDQWLWPADEPHVIAAGGPPARDPAAGRGSGRQGRISEPVSRFSCAKCSARIIGAANYAFSPSVGRPRPSNMALSIRSRTP
jgi:hypothetical protein